MKKRTWYIYRPKENQQHKYNSNEYPQMDFTTGVIRARICVFIDDIYDYDIEKLFPHGYGIRRSMGPGGKSKEGRLFNMTLRTFCRPCLFSRLFL